MTLMEKDRAIFVKKSLFAPIGNDMKQSSDDLKKMEVENVVLIKRENS